MLVPEEKHGSSSAAEKEVKEIEEQYISGLVTARRALQQGGRHLGHAPATRSRKAMMDQLGTEEVTDRHGKQVEQESFNSIYMMADSGARGSAAQIRQLAGMRGLMAKPDGSIIETPITANFREGLNVLQYFISTHGARKGLADTALKTANSGYLTRRLVDVTQDLVVTEDDCGTTQRRRDEGAGRRRRSDRGAARAHPRPRRGRSTCCNPETQAGAVSTPARCSTRTRSTRSKRSASTKSRCARRSPATRATACAPSATAATSAAARLVNVGEAVGVIAAQSIGEPGTQLTMRTFHIGGAASRTAVASQRRGQVERHGRASPRTMRYVTNAQGRAGRDLALRRDHRSTTTTAASASATRCRTARRCSVKDGEPVKAGTGAGQLGSADPPDHHRVRGHA